MHITGGAVRDLGEANRLFALACERKEPLACSNLAVSYEQGRGLGADATRARELHEKACSLGDQQSCARAAATAHGGAR